jgi:hypothetical protein
MSKGARGRQAVASEPQPKHDPADWVIALALFAVLPGLGLAVRVAELHSARLALEQLNGGRRVQVEAVSSSGKATCGAYLVDGDATAWRFLRSPNGLWAESRASSAKPAPGWMTAFLQCEAAPPPINRNLIVIADQVTRMIANLV